MKYALFLAALFVLSGCQQQPQPNITINPPIQPRKAEPAPPVPNVQPVPPVTPSSAFLHGYSDGFHAVWLSPIRWTFASEYRNGWSLGAYDRNHNLPNRYIK